MDYDEPNVPVRSWGQKAMRGGFGAAFGCALGAIFAERFETSLPSTLLVFAVLGAVLGAWGWEALRTMADALVHR